MTPETLLSARRSLGLSRGGLAAALRMGENGRRQVRRWEEGDAPISGPASVAIEALLTGWRPAGFVAEHYQDESE